MGVDFGQRRIGLALSDGTGTLARPLRTVAAGRTPAATAAELVRLIDCGDDDLQEVGAFVVGLPRRLNGDDTTVTAAARAFAEALGQASGRPVHLQDERLTSHEAEQLLAEREPDWRVRKARIDAVAAAIVLQDYLDGTARS